MRAESHCSRVLSSQETENKSPSLIHIHIMTMESVKIPCQVYPKVPPPHPHPPVPLETDFLSFFLLQNDHKQLTCSNNTTTSDFKFCLLSFSPSSLSLPVTFLMCVRACVSNTMFFRFNAYIFVDLVKRSVLTLLCVIQHCRIDRYY